VFSECRQQNIRKENLLEQSTTSAKGLWHNERGSGKLPVGFLKAIRNSFLLASRFSGGQLTGVAAAFPRCKEDSGDKFYI
jgi:hypothetical protein